MRIPTSGGDDAGEREQEPDRDVDAGDGSGDSGVPEVDVQARELARGEPRDRVGADRVEGDVPEVEQARVPDDDVQADRHHDEHEHVYARRHVRPHAEDRDVEHVRDVERVREREPEGHRGADVRPDGGDALPRRDVEHDEDEPGQERRAAPEARLAGGEVEDRRQDDERDQEDDRRDDRPADGDPRNGPRRLGQDPLLELAYPAPDGIEEAGPPSYGQGFVTLLPASVRRAGPRA